jgi:hypothetical protein
MAIAIPHISMPFTLNPLTGKPNYCEQGSAEDVQSQVLNLLTCPVGANPYDADFGNPLDPFSAAPLDLSGLVDRLGEYVPALTAVDISQSFDPQGLVQAVLSELEPHDGLVPSPTLMVGGTVSTTYEPTAEIGITGYAEVS